MSTALLAIRIFLAAVFAIAAVSKLRDLEGSRRAVQDFGVPKRAAGAVGLLLPLVELATAVALVPQPTARWGAVAALALLLAFIAGIANALRKGEAPDCHCFGQIHSAPAGPGTLIRNGILAALAALVIVEGPGEALHTWIGDRSAEELVAVGASIAAVVFGAMTFYLLRQRKEILIDLNSARTRAATAVPGIPLGSPAPDFSLPSVAGGMVTLESLRERGQPMLLVFVSPWCGSCEEAFPSLARWQRTLPERLTIALISSGSEEANRPFVDEYGLENVLIQKRYEVGDSYRVRGTPSAVIVTPEGMVGSNPAESVFGIEPLLRLALRDGAGSLLQRAVDPVA